MLCVWALPAACCSQPTNCTVREVQEARTHVYPKKHNSPLTRISAYTSSTGMHCSMQISYRPTPARTSAGSLHHASQAAIRISNTAFVAHVKVVALVKSPRAEAAARWASCRQVTAYSTNGATPHNGNSIQPSNDAEEEALDKHDDYCAWWDEDDPAYTWDEAAKIAQCVQLLQSNNVQQQALACKRLRRIAMPSVRRSTAITAAGALPHLICLLSESDSARVRRTASVAITSLAAEGQAAALAEAGAVPALVKNLSHPNVAGQAGRSLQSMIINASYGGSKAWEVYDAFTPEVIQQIRDILPDRMTDRQWGANVLLAGLARAGDGVAMQALLDMGYTKEQVMEYRLGD